MSQSTTRTTRTHCPATAALGRLTHRLHASAVQSAAAGRAVR